MNIYIEVKNRIATYRSYGTDPVCGSNSDHYKFVFDSEWDNVNPKTARFIWGEKYYDVEFEGDTCPAPLFENVSCVWVGVYAGEPAAKEPSFSTTKVKVPYGLSIRCGYHSPRAESGGNYTNEAKGYAAEAREAAKAALTTQENTKDLIEAARGMKEVGRISFRLTLEEQYDEMGWYIYPWAIHNRSVNYQNGGLLLSATNDSGMFPTPLPNADLIKRFMGCPMCLITVEAPDPNGVMEYSTLYSAVGGGIHWAPIDCSESSSLSDWALPGNEWATGGVRLVVCDNPDAPGIGYGPSAAFLHFSKEFKTAMESISLPIYDTETCATLTFIGYR